jgi:hypothetical protein
MEYNLIDNFLPEEDLKRIQDIMLTGSDFSWYYNEQIISKDIGDEHFQFTHTFYKNWNWQSNGALIEPLITKINPKAWIRIKANLKTRQNKVVEQGWHTDFEFPCTTAIFYLNDTDGYTVFEDGTKIDCKANRLVEFDSHNKHSGTSHTDAKVRVLLNMNYIKEGGK